MKSDIDDSEDKGFALVQEELEHEARREFESDRTTEGYRSSYTEDIINGRMGVENILKEAPQPLNIYGADFKQDVSDAKTTIEQARKALTEGERIVRTVRTRGDIGRVVGSASAKLRQLFGVREEEVIEQIEDSLYITLDDKVVDVQKAVESSVPAISKGERIIDKTRAYMASLKKEYHRIIPLARDFGDYVQRLEKEIANMDFDLKQFTGSPAERLALEEAISELKVKREAAQNDEATIYERISSLTNRSRMAREDLEQNLYLVGSLKRYVSSARNFVEEAQHRKLYEDLPEYGTLTLETNEAVKALSDCLHNIREKEQAIVRASADMMKQEGIPTDVYHSDDLTYASETTMHVRGVLENQNRASVLRGREEVENMN